MKDFFLFCPLFGGIYFLTIKIDLFDISDLQILLEIIGINIRIAMKFSKALDPHTGFTPVPLVLNAHTVATGAAPVQLPCQGLHMVQGGTVHEGSNGEQGGRKWFSHNVLSRMRTV